MATRDGDQKSSSSKARPKKQAPVKRDAPVDSKPARSSVIGPARRPIQVIRGRRAERSFWVFCDDGTVWIATAKKNTLRWSEAGPPLPGSPEERRLGVATPLEAPSETP